ncbi:hypothetical protein LSAT2_001195 [Lamellibrachia satsuma]|nr:hypothetical protein LSAT2_001195 [Lamellibrachia satsuma]
MGLPHNNQPQKSSLFNCPCEGPFIKHMTLGGVEGVSGLHPCRFSWFSINELLANPKSELGLQHSVELCCRTWSLRWPQQNLTWHWCCWRHLVTARTEDHPGCQTYIFLSCQLTTTEVKVHMCSVVTNGNHWPPKGNSCVDMPQSCVDMPQSCVDMPQSCVDMPQSCVDMPQSCVDMPQSCVDMPQSCVDMPQSCVDMPQSCGMPVVCGYAPVVCGYAPVVCGYAPVVCGYAPVVCRYAPVVCGYAPVVCGYAPSRV